jgi:signal transduction histidine kinase
MADRLADFQEKMKRTERLETLGKLASVLSHEIRNPLNSMVINMQILKREFSREKVNKERVEKFYSILAAEIKRVDQLVKDFLLIARPAKLEPIRIAVNHILDEVLMMNMADSLKKGVRIERHYSEKTVEVDADPAKLRSRRCPAAANWWYRSGNEQVVPAAGKLAPETW